MSRIPPLAGKVKATRRTPRPETSFGAGILPYVPHHGTQPFTTTDQEWAAQEFGHGADWSTRAAFATGDRCEVCNRPVERGELEGGLCNACQIAAEDATRACQGGSAGPCRRSGSPKGGAR